MSEKPLSYRLLEASDISSDGYRAVCDLERGLATLKAENEELRRDRARLDWLSAQTTTEEGFINPEGRRLMLQFFSPYSYVEEPPHLREAIDAAMKGGAK